MLHSPCEGGGKGGTAVLLASACRSARLHSGGGLYAMSVAHSFGTPANPSPGNVDVIGRCGQME